MSTNLRRSSGVAEAASPTRTPHLPRSRRLGVGAVVGAVLAATLAPASQATEPDATATNSAAATTDRFSNGTILDDFDDDIAFTAGVDADLAHVIVNDGEPLARPAQTEAEGMLRAEVAASGQGGVQRTFPAPMDLRSSAGVGFWYHGAGTGQDVTFRLHDDRAPDPGPEGWDLVWSDEFDGPAGSPPDSDIWGHQIGDGTAEGNLGWGNQERQYYTDDPANASLDGDGNLVIRVLEDDGAYSCYYGPCEFTSARLLTKDKHEFTYGRIEIRAKVPFGNGLWPAFWMMGTEYPQVPWPFSGEVDIMEHVGRLPDTVFGTLHGPGYSGGDGFGGSHVTADPVADDVHDFAIEWGPGYIGWDFDGFRFHEATPADVAPNDWVFDHAFFLLLNVAVGGNFGGPVDATFPQEMVVEHVRVYEAPDTAERFETTFTDDVVGWQLVEIPFTELERGANQPVGAPDNGLSLDEVWGYELLAPGPTTFHLDDVRAFTGGNGNDEVIVTNADDVGPGSLRDALDLVEDGGTVRFDPSLAGATLALASPLMIATNVTVDASDAPGFVVDAGGSMRIATISAGTNVRIDAMALTNGSHANAGGALLVNGALELVDVTLTGHAAGGAPDAFDAGGGAIYVSDGGTLALTEVTMTDNETSANGGAIWAGFNTEVSIGRSTFNGNAAGNVAGAVRTIGDLEVVNSTFSGNASAWHGSALFHTDGMATLASSTVTDNRAPAQDHAAVFVGTFTDANAALHLADNAIGDNAGPGCIALTEGAGTVTLTSQGGNVSDGTCGPGPGDEVVGGLGLGALTDNGGPTATHLPETGSPVVDAADDARCPATDQRGVPRPQGDGCDAGAVEREADVSEPTLDLDLAASTRCVAGKVFVVITARNDNAVEIDVEFAYNAGSKAFNDVTPGRFASHAFTTRASAIGAEAVTVRATAIIDGADAGLAESLDVPALSCT